MTAAVRHRKALRRMGQDLAAGGDRARRAHGWWDHLNVISLHKQYRMAPDRRLLMPLATKDTTPKTWSSLTASGGRNYSDPDGAPVSGDGDYRESVYGGPPSLYVSDRTDNGAGTLGDPYQYSQLAANVSAGDVVGSIAGDRRLTSTADPNDPAFNPGVAGTAMARIVYVGQYDPGAMSDPLTDGNRSEWGHTSASHETGGCSTFGFSDYVTYDSLVSNYAHGAWQSDRGAMWIHDVEEPRVYRMWFKGATISDLPSNYCAIWNDLSRSLILSDCTFDTIYANGGSVSSANCSFIILYGAEDFEISNCDGLAFNNFIYEKGAPGGVNNYGIVRRLSLSDCHKLFKIQACHASNVSEYSQILATGINYDAITFGAASGPDDARNITLRNITMVLDSSDSNALHTDDAERTGTGWRINDNITVMTGGNGRYVGLSSSSQTIDMLDNNLYYRASGTQRWEFDSATANSIADWRTNLQASGQAAGSRETNSQHADPLLNGTTYRPGGGSPALTMGSSSGLGGAGGEIGAFGGNPTLGRRV